MFGYVSRADTVLPGGSAIARQIKRLRVLEHPLLAKPPTGPGTHWLAGAIVRSARSGQQRDCPRTQCARRTAAINTLQETRP